MFGKMQGSKWARHRSMFSNGTPAAYLSRHPSEHIHFSLLLALSTMPGKPPMITQQLPSPTENRDAHSEPLNTSYDSAHLNRTTHSFSLQTYISFFPSAFDASRLFVPRPTVRCHGAIITDSQQTPFLQLPKKLRRSKQGHANRGIVRPVSLLVESQQVAAIGSQSSKNRSVREVRSSLTRNDPFDSNG